MRRLCVVGLGHIGLPTAILFAEAGVQVDGVDVDLETVEKVRLGEAPFHEPGLDELIGVVLSSGAFQAAQNISPADAFILAVGTPMFMDHTPDLQALEDAALAVGGVLQRGNLVVVESTVPPGTTDGLVREVLEKASKLKAGQEFHLAYCPERALPGRTLHEIAHNDRLVGGINSASIQAAIHLYRHIAKGELLPASLLSAEISKLAENTYRDVNIALANELGYICEKLGASVWDVVSLANRHPRVQLHVPGPGVGGHCLPKDPWFLGTSVPEMGRLICMSRHLNEEQPSRVVKRVLALIGDANVSQPAKVAILGVAYRGGVDDVRGTPTLPIAEGLLNAGLEVSLHDPYASDFSLALVSMEDALRGADMLLLLTDHPEYSELSVDEVERHMRGRLVLDTRNLLDHQLWNSKGFHVTVLGVGE